MTIGLLLTIAAQIGLMVALLPHDIEGTSAQRVSDYIFPFGISWFALPAVMLFSHQTRLSALALWVSMGVISIGIALWAVPLLRAGIAGQAMRYVDYPSAFAADNLAATAGVLIFVFLFLGVLLAIKRNRI